MWQERNWADIFAEVLALAAELEALGLGPGQALTIIGDNRTRLYTAHARRDGAARISIAGIS